MNTIFSLFLLDTSSLIVVLCGVLQCGLPAKEALLLQKNQLFRVSLLFPR
jgi:hypothetical protein